jgi:pimeloyl-ACP methyl ester carboxylesterase
MIEKIKIITEDGVELSGLYTIANQKKFAILLHMMPSNKESWNAFSVKLFEDGWDVIAIDLRGHGESNLGGKINYKEFSDKEHQNKILDIDSAFKFLEARGATFENTIIIGASIGANLAIKYASIHNSIKSSVVLSPGLDYKGVLTDKAILKLKEDQMVYIITSREDIYSYQSSEKLKKINPNKIIFKSQDKLGHGTTIFENKPELMAEVIVWLKR